MYGVNCGVTEVGCRIIAEKSKDYKEHLVCSSSVKKVIPTKSEYVASDLSRLLLKMLIVTPNSRKIRNDSEYSQLTITPNQLLFDVFLFDHHQVHTEEI